MDDIKELAKKEELDIENCMLIDPDNYPDMDVVADAFVERRNGRASKEEALNIVKDANYFGRMLVYLERADGLVSGSALSTSETVRAALQTIKPKEGIQKTSGVFVMVRDGEKYIFADCAINIAPTSEDLAEIAVESAKTAKLFDVD